MEKTKIKNVILAAIGGAIAMLIVLNVVRAIERKVNSPSEEQIVAQLIKGLEDGAKELNKKTPLMMDEQTRLDSVTVGPGLTSNYFFTFPNISSFGQESKYIQDNLKKEVIANICNNPEMKNTLNHGGVLNYSYSGNDKIEILNFRLKLSDCD